MRSGDLRYQIDLQKKVAVTDSFGEPIETWVDVATKVWADKVELEGRELYAARQVMATVDCIFKIRYRKNIGPLDLIICEGRTYDITLVKPIGWKEGIELYASRRGE